MVYSHDPSILLSRLNNSHQVIGTLIDHQSIIPHTLAKQKFSLGIKPMTSTLHHCYLTAHAARTPRYARRGTLRFTSPHNELRLAASSGRFPPQHQWSTQMGLVIRRGIKYRLFIQTVLLSRPRLGCGTTWSICGCNYLSA